MQADTPLSLSDILTFKYGIKRPQLIGIIAGCIVFSITILTVFILLWKSGTLGKFAKEMQEEHVGRKKQVADDGKEEDIDVLQHLATRPQLHDHLIRASTTLSKKPTIDDKELLGKICILREYNETSHLEELVKISDGSPIYGESAYSPSKLFYWIVNGLIVRNETTFEWPSTSKAHFQDYLKFKDTINDNSRHLVVVDKVLKSLIGMISVVDNSPENLTARLDNIWLTPAFQNKLYGYDMMLTALSWLFETGYRRVTIELDSRHILGKKYVERCGFILESTIRKHMIVHNGRNRDTCLYVMLNSEWMESEVRLKTKIGIDPNKKPVLKVAEISK